MKLNFIHFDIFKQAVNQWSILGRGKSPSKKLCEIIFSLMFLIICQRMFDMSVDTCQTVSELISDSQEDDHDAGNNFNINLQTLNHGEKLTVIIVRSILILY